MNGFREKRGFWRHSNHDLKESMKQMTPVELAQNSETDMAFKPFCKQCNSWHDEGRCAKFDVLQWHQTRAKRHHEQAALAWHDENQTSENEHRTFAAMHERFVADILRILNERLGLEAERDEYKARLHWLLGNITKLQLETTQSSVDVKIDKFTLNENFRAADLLSAIKALEDLLAEDRQMR